MTNLINKKSIFIVLILCFTLSSLNTYAQSRKELRKKIENRVAQVVDSLIKAKDFTIEINRIIPIGSPSRTTTDGYYCKVKKDTFDCYLPYFGTAKSPIMGGANNLSIDVNKEKVNFQEGMSEKDGYIIKFTAFSESTKENWTITLQIFDNGNCNVGCDTNSRDGISYYGTIVIPKEVYIPTIKELQKQTNK